MTNSSEKIRMFVGGGRAREICSAKGYEGTLSLWGTRNVIIR